jgi:proline iminopeptidase
MIKSFFVKVDFYFRHSYYFNVKKNHRMVKQKIKSVVVLSLFVLFANSLVAQNKFIHPEGKYLAVNGAMLWVETSGKGEPLFLIAGGPGESHVYMHAFDTLKDSFLLVFVDYFGRGKSDTSKDVSEYSIARDVEDVEGIRRALGFEKINVLGHSYGSMVAQSYAIKYGGNVSHLIVADGFFSGKMWQENDDNSNRILAENDPELWDSLMIVRKKGFISSDVEHYSLYFRFHNALLYYYCPDNGSRVPRDAGYPNNFNLKVYYELVGADGDFSVGGDIFKYDVTKQLKDLKMPVLVIAGRYDRVSVPSFAVLYKKYCPQARFVMFEHSGHEVQWEEPEKEFALLREFLRK